MLHGVEQHDELWSHDGKLGGVQESEFALNEMGLRDVVQHESQSSEHCEKLRGVDHQLDQYHECTGSGMELQCDGRSRDVQLDEKPHGEQ